MNSAMFIVLIIPSIISATNSFDFGFELFKF